MSDTDMDCSLGDADHESPPRMMLWRDYELDLADRCAVRRQYRSLRIAVYASQKYTGLTQPACQGWYGMSRDDARQFLAAFYQQVAWANYLGSK